MSRNLILADVRPAIIFGGGDRHKTRPLRLRPVQIARWIGGGRRNSYPEPDLLGGAEGI